MAQAGLHIAIFFRWPWGKAGGDGVAKEPQPQAKPVFKEVVKLNTRVNRNRATICER